MDIDMRRKMDIEKRIAKMNMVKQVELEKESLRSRYYLIR